MTQRDPYLLMHDARQEAAQNAHQRAMAERRERIAALRRQRNELAYEEFMRDLVKRERGRVEHGKQAQAGVSAAPSNKWTSPAELMNLEVQAFGQPIQERTIKAAKHGGYGIVPPMPFELWHLLTHGAPRYD
jgi:hypothetical protein